MITAGGLWLGPCPVTALAFRNTPRETTQILFSQFLQGFPRGAINIINEGKLLKKKSRLGKIDHLECNYFVKAWQCIYLVKNPRTHNRNELNIVNKNKANGWHYEAIQCWLPLCVLNKITKINILIYPVFSSLISFAYLGKFREVMDNLRRLIECIISLIYKLYALSAIVSPCCILPAPKPWMDVIVSLEMRTVEAWDGSSKNRVGSDEEGTAMRVSEP